MNWMSRRVMGLDIDEGCLVAAELVKKSKGIYLNRSFIRPNLKEFIKDAFFEKDTGVVINLPTQAVLFRSFQLSASFLKGKNKLKDITAFLGRQNLPFKLEDCYWDTFILNTYLNLIAAKKEVVDKYIAPLKEMALPVLGITVSQVALYNVFIYNYPKKVNERFALLNIRTSASDLLICESKRLWVYPLSIGGEDLKAAQDNPEKFSLEVQRIFNAHYLQNPLTTSGTHNRLYLSAGDTSLVIPALKKILVDFEIPILEPLKNITLLPRSIDNPQGLALSLGICLSYLGVAGCLNINLIRAKIKTENLNVGLTFLKKAASFLVILMVIFLLFLDINLFRGLKRRTLIYKNIRSQVSSLLPEVKVLKERKEKLQKSKDYLEKRLDQQKRYLKAMALISETKPAPLEIKEFSAELKEGKFLVFVSGSSPDYEGLNDFLTKLKQRKDIKEAKVVETQSAKVIDFKLGFQLE